MAKDFSILIPTFNERDNILPLLERISSVLKNHKYEVLFVDDNSSDGTAKLINELSSEHKARVVVRKNKRGLATAITDGFGWVESDTILVMDADLQHPPELIPLLLKAISGGADIAVASRYVKGGGTEGWGIIRKIISFGAIKLAHIFLPDSRRVKDPMSGFFVFKQQAIKSANLSPIGYKILLEILVVGNARKAIEVPFKFELRQKGKSKLDINQNINYVKHIVSLMRRSGEIKRFAKFVLVGIIGTLVNLGILALLHDARTLGLDIRLSLLVAIEVSIITNFLLNNYFTFSDRRKRGLSFFIKSMIRYNFFSLPGGALNWFTTIVLTSNSGASYIILNMIGIAVAMTWNFIANSIWTWKK